MNKNKIIPTFMKTNNGTYQFKKNIFIDIPKIFINLSVEHYIRVLLFLQEQHIMHFFLFLKFLSSIFQLKIEVVLSR